MPRSERPTSERAAQPDERIGALVDLLKGPRRIWLHGPVAVGKSTGVALALGQVGSISNASEAGDPLWIDGINSPRDAIALGEQLRDPDRYPRLRIVSGRAAAPSGLDVVLVRWSPLAADDAGRWLRASAPVDHKTGDGTFRELAAQLDGLPGLLAHAAKLLGGARASLLCERFDDDAALRFELGGPWAIEAADLLAALDADSLAAWVEWCALPALLARAEGDDLVRRLDVAARARQTGWATIPGGDDADSLATPLLPMRAAIEHLHAEQFAGRVQAFAEGLLHETTATAPAFLRLLARNARRARLADTEANLLCRLPSPDSTVSDRLHQLLPRLAQTVRLRALIRIANEHRHRGELDAARAVLEPLLSDPAIPPTADLLVNAARVAYSAGDIDRAAQLAAEATEAARRNNESALEAEAALVLANLALTSGALTSAEGHARRASGIFTRLRDPARAIVANLVLCSALVLSGRSRDAEAELVWLRGQLPELRDPGTRLRVCLLEVLVAIDEQRADDVTAFLDDAERWSESLDDRLQHANIHLYRAVHAHDQGSLEEADRSLDRCLPVFRRASTRGLAFALAHRGMIALERGRDDEARALLDESLELFVRLHDAHHATIFRAFRDGAELPRAVQPVYVRLRSRCVPNRVRAERELEAIEGVLVLSSDCRSFVTPHGQHGDLSRRVALHRILVCLLQTRLEHPGQAVSTGTLIQEGWPREQILPEAAKARVHSAIHTLRGLGLSGILRSSRRGFWLDEDVAMRVVERA